MLFRSTQAKVGWNNDSTLSTNTLQAVVPTEAIAGFIVNNMKVIGPYLPIGTKVLSSFAQGSLTYVNLLLPISVTDVPSLGSTVIANDVYTVTLDKNLQNTIKVGSVLVFDDFNGDAQTLVTDIEAPAGGNTITFTTPIGRSVEGSNIKLKGLRNQLATVANVNIPALNSNNSVYLQIGRAHV